MNTPSLKSIFLVKEDGYQNLIDKARALGFRIVSVQDLERHAPDAVHDLIDGLGKQPGTSPFGGTQHSDFEHGNTLPEIDRNGRFVVNDDYSKVAYYPWSESGHYFFWSRAERAWDLDGKQAGVPELYGSEQE